MVGCFCVVSVDLEKTWNTPRRCYTFKDNLLSGLGLTLAEDKTFLIFQFLLRNPIRAVVNFHKKIIKNESLVNVVYLTPEVVTPRLVP